MPIPCEDNLYRWDALSDFIHEQGGTVMACLSTPYGYVRAEVTGDVTYLSLIVGGQKIERRYKKGYRPRYLSTLALRFAKEATT